MKANLEGVWWGLWWLVSGPPAAAPVQPVAGTVGGAPETLSVVWRKQWSHFSNSNSD